MTTPDTNFRPVTAPRQPRFRLEIQWQGPPLDPHGLHLAQGLLALFAPADKAVATNEDFAATFTCPPHHLAQLLQCLGVLRAHRVRWVVFEADESADDVAERLFRETSWSFYPDPERAVRVQEAEAEKAAKGRPRGHAV